MTQDFDAIVIGGGHNGLAAAATLAGKGKRVCVLERNDTVGGMARNTELAPGVTAPQLAHLLYNLSTKVAGELGIGGANAPLTTKSLPSVSLSEDGNHVVVNGDHAQFSSGDAHPDAHAFATLNKRLNTFAALLGQLSTKSPPKLDGGLMNVATLSELAGLAKLGLDVKRLGKEEMREFLRIILTNAYDLLLDEIEDGPLAGLMAADAVRGNFVGPRSPGTVFNLMYRMGNGGAPTLPMGGMGAVAAAFEAAAKSAGATIRTSTGVERILIERDRAIGVVLEDGSELRAGAVLSNTGPNKTMMLAGIEHFDVEAARRMKNLRCKGVVAKVNLALSGKPEIPGLSDAHIAGRLVIAPSATYVERAFNPVKYGEMPTAPTIEAVIPSLSDPSLCADGQHVLSAVVQFVPHVPEGGWTEEKQAQLVQTTIDTLERYMPGIAALVTHSETLTPEDIEQMTGAPGGHWHHAEMGVDQVLTLRPANGVAHYRFGVPGLYLCGAGAHPGGDVTGAPGRNAALQLLKDGVL